MAQYKTRPGDSPAIIARRHNTSVAALLAANPHKPTTIVDGKRTWQGLKWSERVNMPVGVGALGDDVGLGASASDAIYLLITAGGPCLQANVAMVCAVQAALGVGVDGKYGSGTATAAKRLVPSAPGACSPRPAWWAPVGQSNCPTSGVGPAPTTTPSSSSLDRAAGAAFAALSTDPNYCASVKKVGTAVNTAVHNFKAAWNASHPSSPVPIGTGNYEVSVAAALSTALGGVAVPPGCSATTAAPVSSTPVATTTVPQVSPVAASSGGAPAAVQALVGINPCLQTNSGVVYLAQTALGIVADGKYGAGTAAAARKLVPNAPAACSPAPLWWGAKGTTAAATATQTAKTSAASLPASTVVTPTVKAATTTAAATAQATDAANKAAAATTPAQADQAATDAAAAKAAADRAAAAATTQAQKDAAAAADKIASDALATAQAKGGTAAITPPAEKKLSTGAIVAGAIGAAALVGLVALAASGKKTGHRGRRGPAGRSRRKTTKRRSSKRKKSAKRRK